MKRLLLGLLLAAAAAPARAAGDGFEDSLRAALVAAQSGRAYRYIPDRSEGGFKFKPAQPASTLECKTDAWWTFALIPISATPKLRTESAPEAISIAPGSFTLDLERMKWLARLGPDTREAVAAQAWEGGPTVDVVVRMVRIPYPNQDELLWVFAGQVKPGNTAYSIAERGSTAWKATVKDTYSGSADAQVFADHGARLKLPLTSGREGLDSFWLDCSLR